MGYDCIVTYTKPSESGASLKGAGFYLQEAKWAQGDPDHPKGLLRWICERGQQPTIEERAWTNQTLERITNDMEGG